MQSRDWESLLDRFRALGGVADNICLANGEYGRGLFRKSSLVLSRIFTPHSLLIKRSDIDICDNKVVLKSTGTARSRDQAEFLEYYYNILSWGNGGNRDSIYFINRLSSFRSTTKEALLRNCFLDQMHLSFCPTTEDTFQRFVDERTFTFKGERVLACMLELINHSSYAPGFQGNRNGLSSPLYNLNREEIFHRYISKPSPMRIWKEYGFACQCAFVFSVPFEISLAGNPSQSLKCLGSQVMPSQKSASCIINGHSILIECLTVGSISKTLAFSAILSILELYNISLASTKDAFYEIIDLNLGARSQLLSTLQSDGYSLQDELCKSLQYEIELIRGSITE